MRGNAAKVLSHLGEYIPEELKGPVVDRELELTHDDDSRVRGAAAGGLGESGYKVPQGLKNGIIKRLLNLKKDNGVFWDPDTEEFSTVDEIAVKAMRKLSLGGEISTNR